MSKPDYFETLTKLGLTKSQTEIYLTLTKVGKVPIKTISEATKIDRAHIYQVIAGLQEIGLVERILARPNLFSAISLQEGMQILLERKTEEFSEIKEKTTEIIQNIKESKIEETIQNIKDQFILIPGKGTNSREFYKLFENIHTSFDGIFMRQQHFCWYILGEGKNGITSKLIDKGVKIRLVVCNPENKELPERVEKIVRYLNKKGTFKISYTSFHDAAMLGIFDDKNVFISIASTPEWSQKPSLYSNNRRLVAIVKAYFEQIWNKAEKEQLSDNKNLVIQ